MYELSEAAARDIESILERSVTDFGPTQSENYFQSLKNCLQLLDANPGMGASADEIRRGYRRFAHQSHVIFYRQTESGICIVRILHKHMDVKNKLTSST